MIKTPNISDSLAIDANGVDKLKLAAQKSPDAALQGVAKQFEALFLNAMLKAMREASPKDGLFDSDQTRLYTSMLDQQFAQSLSNKGVGLADMMVKQLSGSQITAPIKPGNPLGVGRALFQVAIKLRQDGDSQTVRIARQEPTTPYQLDCDLELDRPGGLKPYLQAVVPAPASPIRPARSSSVAATDFVERMRPHAEAASRATGIPVQHLLAQAALESGWGKHEIRGKDGEGSSVASYNLFGIKAGRNWQGETVATRTTEYIDGVAQKRVEKFRAYASYEEAFQDYARLMSNNPRYAQVIANSQDAASFAGGLQRAGYATDPLYAQKLTRIIRQIA